MQYDVAIIGGGIIGSGIARDAALRGLRVALFEKEDFGAGTSSRSTRIIHGGLRYLEKLDVDLVYEALHERRRLLRVAPHLVEPLPFLFPSYKGRGHPMLTLWAGIGLYDVLNLVRGMPHHRFLPAQQARRLEPTLHADGLRAAFLYYDAQCEFPERLCVENVVDAAAHGARVDNHVRVTGFVREGSRVTGVRVRHEGTQQEEDVSARLVINAAGPWLDEVESLWNPDSEPKLRRTKGIHLVVPKFNQHALIMETQDAKRVFFAIPWGAYTLLGTTDTDYDGPNETVAADADDVDYLLREIRAVLDVPLTRSDILYTTAGLRPLRRQLGRSTADITRKHEVVDHATTEGVEGLLTVVGGKITTFRRIAEDAVEEIHRKLDRRAPPCPTRDRPLPGAAVHDWPAFADVFREEARQHMVPPDVTERWLRIYGTRSRTLLEYVRADPRLLDRPASGEPVLRAEIAFAVDEEFCGGLSDFMLRRSMWGLRAGQGRAAIETVLDDLQSMLGWDPDRRDAERAEYLAALERMAVAPAPTP